MQSRLVVTDISYARPSSTVVLARASAREPELFMVQRHVDAAFGDAWAFPGGVVDEDDAAVHEYCSGISVTEADSHLGVKADGLELYSAAIRELFEESGVLLADTESVSEDLASVRNALNAHTDSWADIVARNSLALRCDKLHYFSHWVTPQIFSKRYSTRFFLAEMPASQTAMHCGGELTDCRWVGAHDMLEAGRAGDVELHFPTIKTLELIARYQTLEELVEWASTCVQWGVTTMLPALIRRDGTPEIVLPGDKDYPGAKT